MSQLIVEIHGSDFLGTGGQSICKKNYCTMQKFLVYAPYLLVGVHVAIMIITSTHYAMQHQAIYTTHTLRKVLE